MTSRSPRLLSPARTCLLTAVLFALTACGPFGGFAAGSTHRSFSLPSTTKGLVAFSPVEGAAELDPRTTQVLVRAMASGAVLRSVSVQADGGATLATGVLRNGEFRLSGGLKTDTRYVVTAVAAVKGGTEQTETSSFSTATTPRVVSSSPKTIGDGQSVVVALNPPAAAIDVQGPVKGQLSPDGSTVTVVPADFQLGQTYNFALVARNQRGIAGAPQEVSFSSVPAATVDFSPNPGTRNLGVAIPLVMTLSNDIVDKADLAGRLTVTADVHTPAPAGAAGCATYAPPTVASGPIQVTPRWLSANRVELSPKTSDGYWPANSTITLAAKLTGYHTGGGTHYLHDASVSFDTGDKRVIDVDLGGQNLLACRNGTEANHFLISSGTPNGHATFDGSFYIYRRVADEEMKSPEGPFAPDYYDIKHVPWTQYFDGGAALHGAPWHNNFGHPMSHGCINVQTATMNTKYPGAAEQAKWLFDFDYIGDPVFVHGVTPGLSPSQQLSD
ncbi:MAG: L,D-transpeptidase family protein [Candidatus Dormibacteria bacterium]